MRKQKAVGLELNANHIRPVRSGIVTGITKPIALGKSVHVWSIEIFNEVGKMNCVSRLTTAIVDFADVSFTNSTISAAGAMIYNTSASNKAIAVITFSGTVASTAGTFTVTMPTADASNAIIRLA